MRFSLLRQPGIYAVVEYRPDSPVARMLQGDVRVVLTTTQHPNSSSQAALLHVSSLTELDDIAAAAHQHDGLPCGRLQVLSLQQPLVANPTQRGPVIDTGFSQTAIAVAVSASGMGSWSADMAQMAALSTRYHTSGNAPNATSTVTQLFETAAQGKIANWSVTTFTHAHTNQQSVIARIEGSKDPNTTIVLGAHLDSIAPPNNSADAPGADDDASGIAALSAIIRNIADQGLTFERSIEFHGYAAEEVGLVGSQDIATQYQEGSKAIAAMLQLDMVAYGSDDRIYLVKNDTSATLRRDVKNILTHYLGGNFEEQSLSAGTSDHRSWSQHGFPAVFPFEDPHHYNPKIHTAGDTVANAANATLAGRMIQLGVGFLGHYAGLVGSDTTQPLMDHNLKLALIPTDTPESFYIAVAAPQASAAVELCRLDTTASYCEEEIQTLTLAFASGERQFFSEETTGTTFQAEQAWRVQAYDADNQLIARRDVRLHSL